MNVMSLKKILLLGFLSISMAACQHQKTPPTKPTLQIKPQTDGGICLNRDDAIKLGEYILELERQ